MFSHGINMATKLTQLIHANFFPIALSQFRTKHKRMQQEDSDSKSGNKSSGSPRHFEHDDDESEGEIDVDEYPSDEDGGDNDA